MAAVEKEGLAATRCEGTCKHRQRQRRRRQRQHLRMSVGQGRKLGVDNSGKVQSNTLNQRVGFVGRLRENTNAARASTALSSSSSSDSSRPSSRCNGLGVTRNTIHCHVGRTPSRRVRMLLDSGAGVVFFTQSQGDIWASRKQLVVRATDAQGAPFEAKGGEALWGRVHSQRGVVTKRIANAAYVSDSVAEGLLSYGAARAVGWRFFDDPIKGPVLRDGVGDEVPLEADENNHFWLSFEIVPCSEVDTTTALEPAADGEKAGIAIIRGLSKVVRPGGAHMAVRWPSRLPPLQHTPPASSRARQHHRNDSPHLGDDTTDTGAQAATAHDTPNLGDDTTDTGAQAATAAADRLAEAAQLLEYRQLNYRRLHEAWNHNSKAVDKAIEVGIVKDAVRPPGFSCAACAHADPSGAYFWRNTKTSSSMPLIPYHHVDIDLWGPMDVEDRNGFRYLFGAIDRATGKMFVHPLRRKCDAKLALQAYLALIRAQCPGIELHLRLWFKDIRVPGLSIVTSDRAGEFTSTYGYTASEFDELLQSVVHRLNTADTPQSGTSRIERVWGKLTTAARCCLYSSGLNKAYFFDAMVYAADIFNCLPTEANKLGCGEAPDATLGLDYDLGALVPFGTLAHCPLDGVKRDSKNEHVVIIGFNHDGHGYRAVRVRDGTIVTSVHIKPHPALGTARELRTSAATSSEVACFLAHHGNVDDLYIDIPVETTGGHLANLEETAADTAASALAPPPLVQQVGNAPGHGGSRISLRRRTEPRAGSRRSGPTARNYTATAILDNATTRALVRDARAAGLILRWKPGFKKGGKSGERYLFYSKARTFAQFDAMTKETFLSGSTGTRRPKATVGDMWHDAARGIVTFHDPDTPPVGSVDAADADHGDDGGAHGPGRADPSDAADADQGDNDVVEGPVGLESGSCDPASDPDANATDEASVPTVGFGRYLRRRQAVRAATAFVRKRLTAAERVVLKEGIKAKTAYIDVPDVLMMAAVLRHDGVRVPKTLAEAQRSPQWPLWLEALKKEYGGLVTQGVFDEVDRSAVPVDAKVVPTQLLFAIKKDGTFKVRIVVRGDLTIQGEHYIETKSSMVSLDTVRMLISMAAGSDMLLFSTDCCQAFLNAEVEEPHLYCSLPELPPEMRGGEFGVGGRAKVAHVHKAWYGLPQAPRSWQQHLMRFLLDPDKLGAKLFIHDRDAFEWEWQGHRLIGCIHVDDILFAVSSLEIRDEFMRRLKAEFLVTGGEDEATNFCGLEISRDWANHTITLKQEAFARKLMDKYSMWESRHEPTPFRLKQKLVPFEGESDEEETFDYAMCLGDLAWYSRTNPGLSYVVHELAHFIQRPGPEHIEAAHRVLRYIHGHLGAGLTYHGSGHVLGQSYDHLNKLVGAFDADFPHAGAKATSGVTVLLNGAAIAWKTRKQTTVSLNSTEAEIKAMVPGVEMVRSLTGLWEEVMQQRPGCMRVLVDSKPAISQVVHGMDSQKSASYKRAHFYAEDAVDSGLLWLDHIPGEHNPSDLLTKHVSTVAKYEYMNGVLSGNSPHLYETAEVLKILDSKKRRV